MSIPFTLTSNKLPPVDDPLFESSFYIEELPPTVNWGNNMEQSL